MGIYDRDYYRRDGPSLLGSWVERGSMCKWVIGVNVVCFVLQVLTRTPTPLGDREPFTSALILDVPRVLQGEVWRLLSYGFLHAIDNPWHILFNMLILWWFGRQVEDEVGPREFLAFYLVGIVASGLAFVAGDWLGIHRGVALGASGGVMAVLVLCALRHPRQIIYLFFLLPVPIWGVVVFMVAKDTLSMLGRADNAVAYTAHLGGAAFGLLYYQAGLRLTGLLGGFRWPRRRPALRIYREEEPVRAHWTAPAASQEHLEAQMDAILEKISRTGKESLTEGERQVLLRASEAIKRRRS
jgi:membrane associated rhomboid family serine protease